MAGYVEIEIDENRVAPGWVKEYKGDVVVVEPLKDLPNTPHEFSLETGSLVGATTEYPRLAVATIDRMKESIT